MSSESPSDTIVRERAAYWVARVNDSDLSDGEREELQGWLLADPSHEREFRAHNALVTLARDFPSDLQSRLSAYAPSPRRESVARWRRTRPLAIAAALLALVAGGWFTARALWPSYATDTGEMHTVSFGEGSVAYLNTRTKISWAIDESERRVKLGRGEALFDVARDPRPFRVLLENSEIQVLGTRFNVYQKKDGKVVVTVLEGKVAVKELGEGGTRSAWKRELAANQRIVYQPLGLTSDVHGTDASAAVKWRERVLELYDQPIAEVLDELTRYTDQRIVMRDPRIAAIKVGGVLPTEDVRLALTRLEKLAPVDVEEHGGTFTLDFRTGQ